MQDAGDKPLKTSARTATGDLWGRTLNQIRTRLGQMAYLSRLRNAQSGQYEHHGLMAMFGEQEAIEALRRSHEEVFRSFLGLKLEQQIADVARFLEEGAQPGIKVLNGWERTKGYEALLPPATSPAEREYYTANMRLIIRHLRGELAAAATSPD